MATTSLQIERLLHFGWRRRLPVILQVEGAECGLACLGMIAGYYGLKIDIMTLRKKFSISSKGTNLKYMMNIAGRMNLAARALRLDPENLDQIQLPCILHWGLNHFVVLKSIRKNSMVICDPASGERAVDYKTFSDNFTGVALELIPTQEFIAAEHRQTIKLGHFWSKIIGLKRNLATALSLSLILQLLALASPFYMQIVVDDVLLREDTNLLIVLALGFGLLMLLQVGTKTLREIVLLHFSNRLGIQMSANLFHHLIRLPMDYFEKRHIGDVVSRFGSLNKVREVLTRNLVASVIDGIMAIITLVAMFFYSLQLTLIVIGVVFIYASIRWFFFNPLRNLTEESIVAAAKENTHFMETIRAIQTVKIFQRENDRQHHWQNRLAESMNKNIKISSWTISYNTLNDVLFGVENILVIFFAAKAIMGDMLSLGMFYAFMSYKGHFISSMVNLITQFIELKILNVHLGRLSDIAFTEREKIDAHYHFDDMDNERSLQQHSANRINSRLKGKIEVKNLSFRFSDDEPYIFKDLNFVILPGETVALTGPSGCGKTTLIKCLMGLIAATEGEIYIDDEKLDHNIYYRSQIAGVMQDDQLLSGDISENISCFAPLTDTEKVELSAKMACIHDEIMRMPMQYQTEIGDSATNLSGGQKQRIILARALYHDPAILFMDEATSHLDVKNETMVNKNIQSLEITRILIAHRPETIKSANREINLSRF